MQEKIFSRCGMRCDLCLIYRPNVEQEDRREEICNVFRKITEGYDPNPKEIICDSCRANEETDEVFSPECQARKCVVDRKLEHCGYCKDYPCELFPAEPSKEELKQKIDVEHRWTWEEEALMEAYNCKQNMDAFRKQKN